MKISITFSAILAAVLLAAGITAGAPSKHLSPADQKLYNTGKGLYTQRHCDSCHGADLKGTPGMAPSLLPSGAMSHYTGDSFATLMNTNVGYSGKKMSLPMAGKLKADEIKALYVYLSNQ
jgi:cytochrome c553